MKRAIEWADRGVLPDWLIRMGIRQLDRQRLKAESRRSGGSLENRKAAFVQQLNESPIAVQTHEANRQHYEVPAAFFETVLGRHLKYSGNFWPAGCATLDEAEAATLETYCRRAELADGIRVLELGCGWGSLSLWMAAAYPHSRFLAVSNSSSQKAFIEAKCRERNLTNLTVQTADMNTFDTDARFDRIVSVEMFEHMRNWQRLLEKVSTWLTPDGKVFIHIFTHRQFAYLFEDTSDDDWMGAHFFSGGMIPSHDLIRYFDTDLSVEKEWSLNGRHYQKTAEAWLKKLDDQRDSVLTIFKGVYGEDSARLWLQRWRIFFMACAELWGYRDGREWQISHYRLHKQGRGKGLS
jgi:cyclopropane-fatty-acyl-phospholipid synthase